MAVVNTCPYCNRSMSSELTWCPHCEKIYPRTVTCYVCGQAMNSTEAIDKRNKTSVTAYYHPSCYHEVLKEQTCPTCNYTFSEQEQNKLGRGDYRYNTNCPNCGHREISLFRCSCGMPGFIDKAAYVTPKAYGFIDHDRYHQACVGVKQLMNDQKAEEAAQIAAHWKRSGLCVSCGHKISYFEKWFNGGKCKWHSLGPPADY